MNLETIDHLVRLGAALLAYTTLVIILLGIWQGFRRQPGRTAGWMGGFLHSPLFITFTLVLFIVICFVLWKPLPLTFSSQSRAWMLILGITCYFPGLLLTLWGRLALGKNYFISTGFGAQLFSGQHLVTEGPFALVRHPMYAGLILASAGSLLIYLTWTTVFFVAFSPFLAFRARREEIVLAAEFGDEWREYCQDVPAFFPQIRKKAH